MTNKYRYFIGNWKMFGLLSSIKILKRVNSYLNKVKKLTSSDYKYGFVSNIEEDRIPFGLNIWVVSDNLRKGAALNSVQIAEELITRGYVYL